MPLSFNKIEPVRFGGFEAKPLVTAELKLRLAGIKIDGKSDNEEALSVLSRCFPDAQEHVREFMRENMFPADLNQLAAYLTGGPQGLARYDQMLEQIEAKQAEKIIEKVDEQTGEK